MFFSRHLWIFTLVMIVASGLIASCTNLEVIDDGDTVINPTTPPDQAAPGGVRAISVGQGFGAAKGFWEVYFTAPLNTRDRSQYRNGVDERLAAAIDSTRNTLDIAAFELNNERITEAIIDAHERGVRVRVVTDDEHGLEDDDSTIAELQVVGIPVVDDDRSGLMHNKFMIMDGITLWLGSMNYTVNGVYRNNNNALQLRSRRAVETYQEEFNEMFERREFGVTSSQGNTGNFMQDGTPIEIYFAAENEVIAELLAEIGAARDNIRFMTFSFTRDDLGDALMERARAGVDIRGLFETTGSETRFSEMPRLLCAGIDVRQDGNNGVLHHKVFVIDGQTVITGSFNYSNNAVENNDENLMIIRDRDLAALYLQEWERVRSISRDPDGIECS